MQRVNGHRFYDLATKLHPLAEWPHDVSKSAVKDWFLPLWECRSAIADILSLLPLRVCSSPAKKLMEAITMILPLEWNKAIEIYSSGEEIGYRALAIRTAAKEMETVLEAEVQSLDTYLVSQKGTHSTPDLIDRAEVIFPVSIRERLPSLAISDVRMAGRCLALDNPTACGFHILRAVESVMAEYYNLVTGKPIPSRMRNWGIYLKKLRQHPKSSEMVTGILDHIRMNYRNPILHPEVFLSEDDAEALLGVSASAIRTIVMEIQRLEMSGYAEQLELAGGGLTMELERAGAQ